MKNLTKYPNYPVKEPEKMVPPFKPAKSHTTDVNTERKSIANIPEKIITLFLVDDSLMYLTAMQYYLKQEMPSLNIKIFQTGESSLLQMHMGEKPDIIVLDYYLNSEVSSAENGIGILKKIKRANPATKVIMLSCQNKFSLAKNCIKHGALDYVSKGESAFPRIKYLIMNLSGNNDFWVD